MGEHCLDGSQKNGKERCARKSRFHFADILRFVGKYVMYDSRCAGMQNIQPKDVLRNDQSFKLG